jgi:adhesin/invasin
MVRDADGNPLGGIPVTFTVTGGAGTVSDNTPVTGSDGVATVGEWKLGTTTGDNTLSAAVAGQDLDGSPVVFSATGEPGGVSAEQSSVTAAPASIPASTGSSASTITVTVRDAFDNPLSGVAVTLAVSGGSGNTLVQPTSPTGANGVITGKLSSTAVGNRTVSATAGGVAISQTATVTVAAGPPSASTSSATVPPGRAGESTTIEILLKDVHGNPTAGQADAIAISIAGSNNIGGLAANDQGGGRYTVRYTPQVAGTDRVTIRVSGGALTGSPFSSAVAPGPVSPETSIASITVEFVTCNIFSCDWRIEAVVTARDAFGNPTGRGGDAVRMSVDGSLPVTGVDQGDGTYVATHIASKPPPFIFSVVITLNGTAIQGSPFTVP